MLLVVFNVAYNLSKFEEGILYIIAKSSLYVHVCVVEMNA